MSVCLTAGLLAATLSLDAFTLTWVHSVERSAIEEDYRVTATGLVLTEARIKGSGAGFDPPAGSVLRGGWWHYRPSLPPLPRIALARSGTVADWRLCAGGRCTPLGALLPGARPTDTIVVAPCQHAPAR